MIIKKGRNRVFGKKDQKELIERLAVIENRLGALENLIIAMAADKRPERFELMLNAIAADLRIGRYCSFRGTDWDKKS